MTFRPIIDRKRILFVDDSLHILHGLAAALRAERERWDMVFALGGRAGITELRQGVFDVVVSDLVMPDVDGREVLATVRRESPHTIRILLTGSPNTDGIDADVILTKPCFAPRLCRVLEDALIGATSHR